MIVPEPPGHWLTGQLSDQRRDPLGLLVRGLKNHGDAVAYRFGPHRALQLNHPRLIQRVLVDNEANYRKWSALERGRPLLGDGLVLASGPSWRRRRKIYMAAFSRQRLSAMSATMLDAVEGFVERLSQLADGSPIDLLDELMKVTLSIVSRTLISRDLGGSGAGEDAVARELGRSFDLAVETIGRRMLDINPLVGRFPTAANRAFGRSIRAIEGHMRQIIAERRAEMEGGSTILPDLLSNLMQAGEEAEERLDDQVLRDEVLTILLAGRGTSAAGLTWMWWLLDRHPDVEARVRAELLAVLGPDRAPTPEDLGKLDLTSRVFQEAVRLYPPVWTIPRQAIDGDRLDGGIEVAPRTIILISPYVVHRHPALWQDPEQFDPDRFLQPAVEQRSRLAWIPFGYGPRSCVGGWFAMQEALLITAMVARRFRLRAASAEQPALEPRITLKPKGGLRMRICSVAAQDRSVAA